MKVNYILPSLAVAALTFASCEDLDTAPQGSTLTTEQKSEIIAAKPERGEAGVRGIFAGYNVYMPNYTALGASRHNDFGFCSVMYFTDANLEDQSSANNGYNWAGNSLEFYDRVYTSNESQIVWNDHYSIIYSANNVCAGYTNSEPKEDDNEGRFYYAQGLAARAAMYFSLAQLYQFTYKGNESKPCVPIITDENSAQAAIEGAPRATVQEVYDQITKDINKAVELLTSNSYKRSDKRYISLAVALGLRARINLVMQNWSAAADDAQAAIEAAANEGISPAKSDEVNKPTFTSSTEKNWMWGILIAETDDVVQSGIVNWISHCGTFNYGYGQYSGGHQINKKLYEQIPDTDVRKGWWSDANGKSSFGDDYTAYLADYGFAPYTNCKFGTYDGKLECDNNANDIPLMRVEEMYLIKAEALAKAGKSDKAGKSGQQVLEDFVKNHRDPAYTCGGDVQEAVYFQKRIELWGEGLVWYDLMRLNKGIDRRGGGFDPTVVFVIPAGDPNLLWRIPMKEINANPAIAESDNNPSAPQPTPVADED